MYELMKAWIASIVTVIIFLTLVDMILPSGSLQKYTRLVTGLIAIAIILKPIFSIFGEEDMLKRSFDSYIGSNQMVSEAFGHSVNEAEQSNQNLAATSEVFQYNGQTIAIFKRNLTKQIQKRLDHEFGKKYMVHHIEVEQEQGHGTLKVAQLELTEKTVKVDSDVIKTINIDIEYGSISKEESISNSWNEKAATLLTSEFGINKRNITFVR